MATNSKVGVWNRALAAIGESERIASVDEVSTRPAAESCDLHYDDVVKGVLEAKPWPWAMRQTVLSEISEQVTDPVDGDGAQDQFGIPYPFLSSSQVLVELIDSGGDATELEAGDDYELEQADPAHGTQASVTLDTAPAVGESVRITVTTTRAGWDHLYGLPSDCVTPVALLTQDTRLDLLAEKNKEEFDKLINDGGTGYMLACDLDEVEAFEYVTYIDDPRAWPSLFLDAVVFRLAAWLALDIRKDPQMAGQMMAASGAAVEQAFAMARNARQNTTKPTSPSVAARG